MPTKTTPTKTIKKTVKSANSDTKNQIQKLKESFPKGYGQCYIGNDEALKVEYITTPIPSLNKLLGSGIPVGRIVEIYGQNGTGKTTLTLQLIAGLHKSDVKKERNVIYIDMENTFYPEYATSLGVDLDRTLIVNPYSGEKAFAFAEHAIINKLVDLIVFDSVSTMISEGDLEGDKTTIRIGGHSRMMSAWLQRINATMLNSDKKVTCIFLNQLRNKINTMGYGPSDAPSGGMALGFYASVRIQLINVGQIKNSSGTIGNQIRFNTIKNRFSKPKKQADIAMIYGRGFDLVYDTIYQCIQGDILVRKGNWIYLDDNPIGNGFDKAVNFVRDNPTVLEDLMLRLENLEDNNSINEIDEGTDTE